MSKELVPASDSVISLGKNAIKEMQSQRALLKKFVQSQLVEANFEDRTAMNFGEGDFGRIPGTKRMSLLKPGAEKLMRLFSMGFRTKFVDKVIDRESNFAMFTYEAEIFLLRNGVTVATLQATANSQEDKFRERTEWIKNDSGNSESVKVETPIFDILNTLQKMAQKRAMVGAVILATGASEYFTTDMIESEELYAATARDVSDTNTTTQKTGASSVAPPVSSAPMCCGKRMMISKYVDQNMGVAPWYCMACKKKLHPNEEAS